MTDPSYSGQILVQTTPMIGNTGVNRVDEESAKVQVAGFVVHELTRRHSNFRATGDLSGYLAAAGVLGLAGVDTRALTRVLRTHGVLQGALTDDATISDAELVRRAVEGGAPDGGAERRRWRHARASRGGARRWASGRRSTTRRRGSRCGFWPWIAGRNATFCVT
ncbi:MAG: carbamoyl-phosphate synthase domain-containing protein [Phycisphaerales bacterium]